MFFDIFKRFRSSQRTPVPKALASTAERGDMILPPLHNPPVSFAVSEAAATMTVAKAPDKELPAAEAPLVIDHDNMVALLSKFHAHWENDLVVTDNLSAALPLAGVKSLSIDSLSLEHEHSHSVSMDRHATQAYAEALLARRVSTETAENLPSVLLSNVQESLAVLIGCRLRAYAMFLARHGLAMRRQGEDTAGLEGKLGVLLNTGSSIACSEMELRLVVEETVDEEATQGVALELQVDLLLELLPPSGEERVRVPILLASPGMATASADAIIEVALLTENFLTSMIDAASTVMAGVIDIANTESIVSNERLSRSESFLAMPPPPPKLEERSGLDLLSAAALNVVSPELKGSTTVCPVPQLQLDEEDDDEDVVSHLSPDQCADIVDGIFGSDLDVPIMTMEPPLKKLKIDW